MSSRYDQFLEKDNYQSTRQLRQQQSEIKQVTKAELLKYKSIKISESSYRKLELMKLATGESYISHLDKAIEDYFEMLLQTNEKLNTLNDLL
ncbi:hypothetical protein CIRMBP1196_01882 [Enterococcus cecorum]|uniref:hypothetical protein n=1 Tax=Enterococcus cecorum TaxID=44008 RepID=UPI0006433C2F|nr:hypothetical protein [Enterococcus cecorum]KLO70813.1 hypothetical protein AA989_10435 [Enterococcus cecorum]CAI3272359.1 hypothetical protein CIRMBP1216_00295 [Enterococcus cecorum]CAI3286504.1 hypothetical protein CIRMBP1229_00383 [Enterococcus cecorum]CAI3289956.1 hypothetical protein CIRMBP1227_00451 [Enterococcus cecorum]CAI3305175.1 hypothetical protein CIRMBP1247_00718 [Enterococcus cecorum]